MNFWLPDRYGRKTTIYIACVLLVPDFPSDVQGLLTCTSAIVGALLQTAAQNIEMLFVGRVIGGVGTGLVFGVCPVFMSEISPPAFRGMVGGLYNMNTNLGYTGRSPH